MQLLMFINDERRKKKLKYNFRVRAHGIWNLTINGINLNNFP